MRCKYRISMFLLLLLYLFSTSFVNMFLFTLVSVQEAWTKQIKFVPKLSTTVKNCLSHVKDFETVYLVPLGSETGWHENAR